MFLINENSSEYKTPMVNPIKSRTLKIGKGYNKLS